MSSSSVLRVFGLRKFVVTVRREDVMRPREYTCWAKTKESAEDRALGKAGAKEAVSEQFLEIVSTREVRQ